jgi:hypothetical protein
METKLSGSLQFTNSLRSMERDDFVRGSVQTKASGHFFDHRHAAMPEDGRHSLMPSLSTGSIAKEECVTKWSDRATSSHTDSNDAITSGGVVVVVAEARADHVPMLDQSVVRPGRIDPSRRAVATSLCLHTALGRLVDHHVHGERHHAIGLSPRPRSTTPGGPRLQ